MMSATRKNHFIISLLAVVTVLVAMVIAAAAQDKPSQVNSWQTARVIAHLSMKGGPVSEMFLETQNRRQYLFVSQLSKQDYTVIDVSKPEHPSIADNVRLPHADNSERVRMVGSGLALDETPESAGSGGVRHELVPAKNQPATTAVPPTESVRLLDLSDPKNPRTLQTFEGVTSVLADDGRSLIYIANNEGLWILRHRQYQRMPLCDSESVFSPIADCQ
jgi:hypothetical protein